MNSAARPLDLEDRLPLTSSVAMPELLTRGEVATILNVSRRSVAYLINSGQLKLVSIGPHDSKSTRVTRRSLEAFLNQ